MGGDSSVRFRTGQDVPIKAIDNKDNTYALSVQNAKPLDGFGRESFNTVFGETTVGERTDYINIQFQYNISNRDTITTLSGTGTTSHTDAIASVNSGTGIGKAQVRSVATNRYVTGHECIAMFTADFGTPELNTIQRIGYGDDDDLLGFGYNGLDFGIWFTTDGLAPTHIPLADFNGKIPNGYTLNPNAYNIYMVTFGWLGIAPIAFSVYGGLEFGWINLHNVDITNQGEAPHLGNPTLPIQMEVERTTGAGANIELKTSSWRASIIGKNPVGTLADRTFQKFVTAKTIAGGGVDYPVITIKNKDTFQGKINHVRIRYGTVTLASDGTKPVIIKVFRNGTLTGASFVDYDTDDSVAQYDISATSYTPTEEPIGGTLLPKVGVARINLFSDDVIIPVYPNETVTLTAASSNSSELDLFLRHIEEF